MKMLRFLLIIFATAAVVSAAIAQEMSTPPEDGGYSRQSSLTIGVPKSSILAVEQYISFMQSRMKQLTIQLASAKEKIAEAKGSSSAGTEASTRIAHLESQAAQTEEQISSVQYGLACASTTKSLGSLVDVSIKSSTVRQAAEALSRASGMKILVDGKVPREVTVSAEAHSVPLGAVLEVLAYDAGLIIAPTEDGKLLLRLPGTLVVGNRSYVTDGDAQPWSDDWGLGFQRGVAVGRRWMSLYNPYYGYSAGDRSFTGSTVSGPDAPVGKPDNAGKPAPDAANASGGGAAKSW